MPPLLHDRPELYEAEYKRIRGTMTANGSSLNEWLRQNGINRQLAYKALRGQSFGPKARKLRTKILNEILGENLSA